MARWVPHRQGSKGAGDGSLGAVFVAHGGSRTDRGVKGRGTGL